MSTARRTIVVLTLLFVSIGAASYAGFSYWTRPTHEAVAYFRVLPPIKLSIDVNVEEPQIRNAVDEMARSGVATTDIEALVKSPRVLEQVISKPMIAQAFVRDEAAALAQLAKLIRVEFVSPTIMTVSITGKADEMDDYQQTVDAIAEALIVAIGEDGARRNMNFTDLLHHEMNMRVDRIAQLSDRVAEMKKENAEAKDGKASIDQWLAETQLDIAKKLHYTLQATLTEMRFVNGCPDRVNLLQRATVRKL